jgi:hypothetical protein
MRTWGLSIVIGLALAALMPAQDETQKTLGETKAAFAKADKALNEAWAPVKKALPEPAFAELQIKQRDSDSRKTGRIGCGAESRRETIR